MRQERIELRFLSILAKLTQKLIHKINLTLLSAESFCTRTTSTPNKTSGRSSSLLPIHASISASEPAICMDVISQVLAMT